MIHAMKLADFPEVNALPVREKLRLLDELWLSITPELGSLEVSQEEKDLLDSRWTDFVNDPGSALTLEQFRERMKALRP
jgi:putative addiction module component (TIGR02574 family)